MTTLAETAQVSENYINPLVIQGVHLQLQEYNNIIIPRDYALQESIRVECVGLPLSIFQGYLIKRPIFMDQYSFFMLISYGFLDRKAVKVAIQ